MNAPDQGFPRYDLSDAGVRYRAESLARMYSLRPEGIEWSVTDAQTAYNQGQAFATRYILGRGLAGEGLPYGFVPHAPEPPADGTCLVEQLDDRQRVVDTWWPCTEGWVNLDPSGMDPEELVEVLGDAKSWPGLIADSMHQSLLMRVIVNPVALRASEPLPEAEWKAFHEALTSTRTDEGTPT